jgi:hypothetical protein
MPRVDDDQPTSQRPTADDIRCWRHTLDAFAERERPERRTVEPVRIQAGGDMLDLEPAHSWLRRILSVVPGCTRNDWVDLPGGRRLAVPGGARSLLVRCLWKES